MCATKMWFAGEWVGGKRFPSKLYRWQEEFVILTIVNENVMQKTLDDIFENNLS